MLGQFDPVSLSYEVSAAFNIGQGLLSSIGRGRHEADAIVPIQNQIGARLKWINDNIPTSSILQLQAFLAELRNMGQQFNHFVSQSEFRDGRASQQALNTIMPLIDGTSGYHWPPPMQPTLNHAGPPGGGEDGTMGSVQRQLLQMGGTVAPMQFLQGGPSSFSTIPSLQPYQPGFAYLPQSGMLPPTAPYSSIQSPGLIAVNTGGPSLPLLAGAAVILFLLWKRR